MKRIIYFLTLFSINSCLSGKTTENCIENMEFKQKYYYYVDNIESYTLNRTNSEGVKVDSSLFNFSLKQIGKYNIINYGLLLNYVFGYPSEEYFYNDKEKWIIWYESNKCKNLKWIDD